MDGEMHVDLACWVALIARSLGELSVDGVEKEGYFKEYKGLKEDILRVHWDTSEKRFSDISMKNDGILFL